MVDLVYDEQFFTGFYEKHGGGNYSDRALWMPFFSNIADQIIALFSPRTVLDAGCAMGYLVEALRIKGVEAYGIDISEYAITHVADSIKPFCFVHSITEPLNTLAGLPERFDLVVTIEVLEHIPPEEAERAINNISQVTEAVLFSSTPNISDDPTHLNVQLQENWVESFAKNHFFRALSDHFDFISPWTIFLMRGTDIPRKIFEYEKYLRMQKEQIKKLDEKMNDILSTDESMQYKVAEVKLLNDKIRQLTEANKMIQKQAVDLDHANQMLQTEVEQLVHEHEELLTSTAWRITKPIRMLLDFGKWFFLQNALATNLKKAYRLIQNEGFKSAFKKIAGKIIRKLKKSEKAISNSQAEDISTETNKVKRVPADRRLHPVPSVYVDRPAIRLNYLTDAVINDDMSGMVSASLRLASRLANKMACALRIITRTSESDPYLVSKIALKDQFELPSETTYYSDFDRDEKGNKSFKLELSERDYFLVDSVYGALASRWTTYASIILIHIHGDETLTKPELLDNDLYNRFLMDQNVHFILSSRDRMNRLLDQLPVIRTRCHLIERTPPTDTDEILPESDTDNIQEIVLLIEEDINRVSN